MGRLPVNLRPPDVTDAIPRDAANPDMVAAYKLTIITGGPGYGKTTLAAQIVAPPGVDKIWIRPIPDRRFFLRFLNWLAKGLASYYPGFTTYTDDDILDIGDMAGFIDTLASCIEQDLFLVIDECGALDESPETLAFVQALLDRHIPYLHLILSGRKLPALKLSRLTAGREVLRLGEPDLAFGREGIRQLYAGVFGLNLSVDEVEQLWNKTRGWVSGLVLFHEGLNGPGASTGRSLQSLSGSHHLIADYFKENVYDLLSPEEQIVLVKTAVLDPLDADFCSRFLGRARVKKILRRLETRHCFVRSLDPEQHLFSVHPLFRSFLAEQIPAFLGPEYPERLNTRAARLYERDDRGPEALVHHIRAGNLGDASRLLNRFARPIIKQDRPHMLKSLLSVIPAHYMDDEPWFQYLQAGYYGLCSQLKMAVNAYERLLKIFRSQRDDQGECLVLMELAEYYQTAGRMKRAEHAYNRIIAKDALDPFLTIMVMGHLVRVLALAGRTGEADRYADKAKKLTDRLEDSRELNLAQAWIYVASGYRYAFSGGYQRAMELGESAKPLLSAVGEYRFLFSAYFLISYACFYLGRFAKGVALAEEGLELARERGIYDEFSEFLRLLRAKNRLELASLSEKEVSSTLTDCKKSLHAFETSDFPGGVAQGYLVLHQAYLRQGETIRAEKSLRRGIAAVRGDDMPLVKNELHIALSRLLLFEREPDGKQEAFSLLKAAEQEVLHSGWHISWISRIFARYYWEHGHRETAYKYMVYALKIAEEEMFDAWVLRETGWVIPLLVSMASIGAMRTYVRKLFSGMNATVHTNLAILKKEADEVSGKTIRHLMALVPKPPPKPLSVTLFGRFRLFVGETEILPEQWKSRKALTLFKFLLAKGRQGFVDRDMLMELLWPDEDPRKSAQRFHVALASVRKTLEPDIPRGIRSAYIRRSGTAYKIELGPGGRVDTDRFAELLSEAGASIDPDMQLRCYKKAADIYQGPFLMEDPYDAWCVPIREGYKKTYLGVLENILVFNERRCVWDTCISVATEYLAQDPYDEAMIRRLMQYHAAAGNPLMVSRVYRDFQEAVIGEFNCRLSEETRTVYRKLVSRAS
ncbi:MAG: hypothetical protein MI802_24820 [Desulfobacterales bacterium]|nr:hypothetical protein [Desulfobacterales bacterium]